MRAAVRAFDLGHGHARVTLRRFKRAVAEESLYVGDIGPARHQMSRAGVPPDVGTALGDATGPQIACDDHRHGLLLQRAMRTFPREPQGALVALFFRPLGADVAQILGHAVPRLPAHWHNAVFAALAFDDTGEAV